MISIAQYKGIYNINNWAQSRQWMKYGDIRYYRILKGVRWTML